MGLLSVFRREKHRDAWDAAEVLEPRMGIGTSGRYVGAFYVFAGVDAVLPKTPRPQGGVSIGSDPEWLLVLVDPGQDGAFEPVAYETALRALRPYALDATRSDVLVRGLRSDEMGAVAAALGAGFELWEFEAGPSATDGDRYGLIDKAEFHYDDVLQDLRARGRDVLAEGNEAVAWRLAGNHIGIFVRWLAERDLLGEPHDGDDPDVGAMKRGIMSGAEYLLKHCDGALTGEDVSDEAFPFVDAYYTRYLESLPGIALGLGRDTLYFSTMEQDYRVVKAIIDSEYARYVRSR